MCAASLTCDGLRSNFTMFAELRASIESGCVRNSSFPHPATQENVCLLLNDCHMMKLVRNSLASPECLKDASGSLISCKAGIRATTKLRAAHIDWQKQKIKVNLAAQILSSSTADAIDFCPENLQLPQFRGSEATVNFIQLFDRLSFHIITPTKGVY